VRSACSGLWPAARHSKAAETLSQVVDSITTTLVQGERRPVDGVVEICFLLADVRLDHLSQYLPDFLLGYAGDRLDTEAVDSSVNNWWQARFWLSQH
jgi:hypothetical protein